MRREIIRGKSPEDVQAKVDRMIKRQWYPVSDIVMDPSSFDGSEFVCVVETKKSKPKSRTVWGSEWYLK